MIDLRLMTTADFELGMRLKTQAGWNQTIADWRRFLAMQPNGCFVAELHGAPVGTAVACVFGSVAWIAMVLVDAEARGRGVGTALVHHAVTFADQHGATSVRLDATPLGQPLYERLGFAEQYRLARYVGVLPDCSLEVDPDQSRIAQAADYEAILALDQAVTSTNRHKFLARLFAENVDAVHLFERSGEVEGYLTVRAGSDALQLGPCVGSEQAGEYLVSEACRRFAGERVVWDVPELNRPALRLAGAAGLEGERTLLRMCRGPLVDDDVQRLWASSGPELG